MSCFFVCNLNSGICVTKLRNNFSWAVQRSRYTYSFVYTHIFVHVGAAIAGDRKIREKWSIHGNLELLSRGFAEKSLPANDARQIVFYSFARLSHIVCVSAQHPQIIVSRYRRVAGKRSESLLCSYQWFNSVFFARIRKTPNTGRTSCAIHIAQLVVQQQQQQQRWSVVLRRIILVTSNTIRTNRQACVCWRFVINQCLNCHRNGVNITINRLNGFYYYYNLSQTRRTICHVRPTVAAKRVIETNETST